MGKNKILGRNAKKAQPQPGAVHPQDQSKRPEQSKQPGHRDYKAAALYLAKSYGNMLKEQEYINDVLSGKITFTRDDALLELISTTASTESDTGVRVQTSNTSNTTERIGLLLAGGYVEKRNREILDEIIADNDGRQYLAWKIDVIETAKKERMEKLERGLVKRYYSEHWTYKRIRERYMTKKIHNHDISKACKNIITALADEVALREYEGIDMVDRLFKEVEAHGDDG